MDHMSSLTRLFQIIIFFSSMIGAFSRTGYFFQVNDFHFDPYYGREQESCYTATPIPVDKLGKFGHYNCDAPWRLIESSLFAMREIDPDPDFILWTGDNVLHLYKNDSRLDTSIHLDIQANITRALKAAFPRTKFFMTLGNHDYHPKNQPPAHSNPYYDGVADLWQGWLSNPIANATFRRGAYYTDTLPSVPGLRIVSVNTNIYTPDNKATSGSSDPGDQLQWLDDVMKNASRNREKVPMIIHYPIGGNERGEGVYFRSNFNKRLSEIIIEHADIIVGIFAAHTHSDTYKMFYKNKSAAATLFVAPAVTPIFVNNPGIRRFAYDTATFELLDLHQYYLSLPDANSGKKMKWQKEYEARKVYGIKDMTARSMHNLLQQFKQYGNQKFHRYYDFNRVNVPPKLRKPCDARCKQGHLCAIEHTDYDKYHKCWAAPPPGSASSVMPLYYLSLLLTIVACQYIIPTCFFLTG